jgi:hypothetical protein
VTLVHNTKDTLAGNVPTAKNGFRNNADLGNGVDLSQSENVDPIFLVRGWFFSSK